MFLINKVPSKVLSFGTPLKKILSEKPSIRHFVDLPLKIFGCTVFVTNNDLHKRKLDPRAQKCVFVGYSSNQKGYKCFDPVTKKYFVTMDVKFFENQSFLKSSSEREQTDKQVSQSVITVSELDFLFHDSFLWKKSDQSIALPNSTSPQFHQDQNGFENCSSHG